MKKNIVFILLLVLILASLFPEDIKEKAQESFVSLLNFTLRSGIEYPVEWTWDLLNPGIPVTIKAGMLLPPFPWLSIDADFSYSFLPVITGTNISVFNLGIGPRFMVEFNPRWVASLSVFAGGYYSFFNVPVNNADGGAYAFQQGGSFYFSAGCGLEFYLSSLYSMGINISSVNYYFGYPETGMEYLHTIRGGLEGSLHFDGFRQKVSLDSIQFAGIFPAHYKYYENNTAGTCIIRNKERFPASDISISVFIKQFMDSPTKIPVPSLLQAGHDQEVNLKILLTDKVLDLKESNKVTAEIEMEYNLNGSKRQYKTYSPVRLYNRNAMTWDNPKKAAAFITATDPVMLKFAKPAAAMAGATEPVLLDENLKTAMVLFNALAQYGITYGSDPHKISYQDASGAPGIIDFVLFPAEMLYYKTGDCDDLTVLFCTLLETVGIETAFIFVPGHIFPAFRTQLDERAVKIFFYNKDDFIVMENNSVWIPFEATIIGESFQHAWKSGAEKWRAASGKGEAEFHPVHDCWKIYEATDAPVIDSPFTIFPVLDVKEKFAADLERFIAGQLPLLIGKLKNGNKNSNRKGILYAQYGFYEQAENIFLSLSEEERNFAAIVNLGNLYLLRGKKQEALEQYKKAEKIDPGNAIVTRALQNMADLSTERQPADNSGIQDAAAIIKRLKWVYEEQ